MVSIIFDSFSVVILLSLHFLNYQVSNLIIRPTLLPILLTTNITILVQILNKHLKLLGKDHQISTKYLSDDLFKKKPQSLFYTFLVILFNILASFSFQLILLFLFDIINLTDDRIRHMDWFITLTTLVCGLCYVVPSLLLFYWIFETKLNDKNNKKILYFIPIFSLWCIILKLMNILTVGSELEINKINFLQISLFQISLFGVSCLAMLNGLGCIMGFLEAFNWYYNNRPQAFNFSYNNKSNLDEELQKLETLEKSIDNFIDTNKLNHNVDINEQKKVLKSMLTDQMWQVEYVSRHLVSQRDTLTGTLGLGIKFGFWGYCCYKVFSGIIKSLLLLFTEIGVIEKKKTYSSHNGSGDLLSSAISEILVKYVLSVKIDEVDEALEQWTMIVNFLLSISFFYFSFQNVLTTFTNIKNFTRSIVFLNNNEFISKITQQLNIQAPSTKFDSRINAEDVKHWRNLFNELTVCEVTGIYIVSTALLLNSTTVPQHLIGLFDLDSINKANSLKIDADFINDWFDRWFLVGAVCTTLCIILIEQLQLIYHGKCNDYQEVYDEEELIQGYDNNNKYIN